MIFNLGGPGMGMGPGPGHMGMGPGGPMGPGILTSFIVQSTKLSIIYNKS